MGGSQDLGYHFGDANRKDHSIWGLYGGPLIQGKYHIEVGSMLGTITTSDG